MEERNGEYEVRALNGLACKKALLLTRSRSEQFWLASFAKLLWISPTNLLIQRSERWNCEMEGLAGAKYGGFSCHNWS